MRFLSNPSRPRVAIIGFGYVGSCLGVTLAERGVSVIGIDSNASLVGELRAGRSPIPEPGLSDALARLADDPALTVTTDHDRVRDADVVIITVGTPVDEHGVLLVEQLEEVCLRLSTRLRAGQLVLLKSTVSPGTTRETVVPLLERGGLAQGRDFGLAFCPERLAEGAALAQLRELPVVVGGCDEHSTAAAAEFWRRSLGVEVHTAPSVETAEVVKLATNWWIDANVAMANELARFCSLFDVDVLDVITTANALPKGTGHVNILLPSVGVGGSCLTKDPWMAWRAAADRGTALHTVETARRVNDGMPEHTYQTIRDELVKLGKDPAGATIAVLGAAFKNDTGDLRNTPVKPVVDALRAEGATVRLFDPLADPAEMRALFGAGAATLREAVAGVDCVAVLAGHRLFRELDFAELSTAVTQPCLVFDGRAYYSPERIGELRGLGFAYRGVGR
ncbi:nucleotide sugar dehydrogenase [Umezawaea sp. NPDC059074]|uniref:nucleotide sugar dehydrogenase n=1 Tax=Umezawaea sp. NPDC059074 TaxID=3346716 RepID=UPI00368E19BE